MANKLLVNRLNKRVTILRPRRLTDPLPDTDEYGQPIDNPIPVATVWAAIEPLRGQDRYVAKQESAEVTTRIRIRFREDVDRTMFVQYGEHTFDILYIIRPEFGKTELQLMSKERQ